MGIPDKQVDSKPTGQNSLIWDHYSHSGNLVVYVQFVWIFFARTLQHSTLDVYFIFFTEVLKTSEVAT